MFYMQWNGQVVLDDFRRVAQLRSDSDSTMILYYQQPICSRGPVTNFVQDE